MNRFYVATFAAAVATTLLASRVLMLRGSRSAIPRMLARVRFDLEWVLRGARNFVDQALSEISQGKPVSVTTSRAYGCSIKYGS